MQLVHATPAPAARKTGSDLSRGEVSGPNRSSATEAISDGGAMKRSRRVPVPNAGMECWKRGSRSISAETRLNPDIEQEWHSHCWGDGRPSLEQTGRPVEPPPDAGAGLEWSRPPRAACETTSAFQRDRLSGGGKAPTFPPGSFRPLPPEKRQRRRSGGETAPGCAAEFGRHHLPNREHGVDCLI